MLKLHAFATEVSRWVYGERHMPSEFEKIFQGGEK